MLENCGTAEKYYVAVRPQTNEIHSVHREGCPFMPDDGKRIYLGFFPSGNEAGIEGKKYFNKSHGCRYCAKESFNEQAQLSTSVYTAPVISRVLEFLN